MRKSNLLLAVWPALLIAMALPAMAQPAGGPGPGPRASASAPGPGGPGPMRGMGRYGRGYTHGWSMMTPEERTQHRQRMAEARTADDCRAVRDAHRAEMEQRAKDRGMTSLPGPRRDACAAFPAR